MEHRPISPGFGLTFAACLLAAPACLPAQSARIEGPYAELGRAARLIEAGKFLDAERKLTGLTERIPDSAALWYQLALVNRKLGRPAAAGVAAERAVELDPRHFDGLLLAAELAAAKDKARARRHARAAAKLAGKDPTLLERAARVLLDLDDVASAIPVLQRASTISPRNRELLRLQARAAIEAGEPRKALEAYRALAKDTPRDPTVLESVARVLVVLEKKKDAVEAFERLLAVNPSNVHARETLLELMRELEYPPKRLAEQKLYLDYYRELRRRAAERKARPGDGK